MAILLLVSETLVKEPYNNLGDVIGVFEDTHTFSSTELQDFDFLTVMGSRQDVKDRLDQIQPEIREAFFVIETQKYQFPPIDPAHHTDHVIEVIHDGNRWRKLETGFKFAHTITGLTPEEKQFLATFDINHPSVDSAVRKLAKDVLAVTGNDVEVRDLRNQDFPA